MDLNKILSDLLNVADEFAEAQVENVFGKFNDYLDEKVGDPETSFTAKGKQIIMLGLRDKLIKILPLEDFPLD